MLEDISASYWVYRHYVSLEVLVNVRALKLNRSNKISDWWFVLNLLANCEIRNVYTRFNDPNVNLCYWRYLAIY